jgi:mannose/fructose/N-acetylgalactosamine-specific phosphotransferase system component IID
VKPTRSDQVASFLRCFAVQGSWNYRSLVAGGLANAMLPLLRRIYAGDPVRLQAAVERHLEPFNGHPYLCPMAVTALARLEHDGESPERIDRFRSVLRAPLGAVGDELVWATWRPFCLLLSITLFWLWGRPWVAVGVFLGVYNLGHIWLRAWSFRRGWTEGLDVGKYLGDPPWVRVVPWITSLNLWLVGSAVVLVSWLVAPDTLSRSGVALGLAAAALLGYARPALGERLAAGLVLAAPVVLVLLGA